MTAKNASDIRGLRVLLVEDEPLIAELVNEMLVDLGCQVIGPAYSLTRAQALASDTEQIDAALLDVNIGGHKVYPCAQTLTGRNVAIAFLTGSGSDALPVEWCAYPALQKPMNFDQLAAVLQGLAKLRSVRRP
jgi:DNA-binding response OmpR family regulator